MCFLVWVLRLDEDLVECLVLVYDLGYMFFGYEGEDVMYECMVLFGGFDYNV